VESIAPGSAPKYAMVTPPFDPHSKLDWL